MVRLMKLACVLIYVVALATAAGLVGGMFAGTIQTIAVVLLVAHALEAAIFFKYVKLYQGPLIASVVLTLLFGFLHWLPLARKARRSTV